MKDDRIDFLLSSISDIQGTIRAMDTKLIGIFIFLIIPITGIGKITNYCLCAIHVLHAHCSFCLIIFYLLVFCFTVTWILAVYTALKGISAIDNPFRHLRDTSIPPGTWYNGGLFKLKINDAFVNRLNLKSLTTIIDQFTKLPDTEEKIIRELLLEQHKCVYIRSLKMVRQKWSFIFLKAFLVVGFLLWLTIFYSRTLI